MNNVSRIIFAVTAIGALLSGCVTRRYVVEQPRHDMTVEGNRGYLMGSPSSYTESADLLERRQRLGDTRKINVLEIDIPAQKDEVAGETCPDYTALTSQSSRTGARQPARQSDTILFQEPSTEMQDEPKRAEPMVDKVQAVTKSFSQYTVQKNDTLQKISSKFYGTTTKWTKLYKENKDVIKNPNKLRPGTVIKIPLLKSLK